MPGSKHLLNLILLFAVLLSGGATAQSFTQLGADIDGESYDDMSGISVAISADGRRLAIGAPLNEDNGLLAGQVRVYDLIGGAWVQIGVDLNGVYQDQFGTSVALSANGERLAVGAPLHNGNGDGLGMVRVYDLLAGVWVQVGVDIEGDSMYDNVGYSVSLTADGTRLATGAPGSGAGGVRVYKEVGGAWNQVGVEIVGEVVGDQCGFAVSLSADGVRVAMSALSNDDGGTDAGQVRVYDEIGGAWTQVGADIDGTNAGDMAGWVSLAANGERLAIGAIGFNGNGPNSGHVRVFQDIGGVWTQVGADIQGEMAYDTDGRSVALSADGTRLAMGAINNDGNGTEAGQVRIFDEIGGVWTQVGLPIEGEAEFDHSGSVIALTSDGGRLAIGAPHNDGNGPYAGQVRVFDLTLNIGLPESTSPELLQVFPSPTSDRLTLRTPSASQGSLSFVDAQGRSVLERSFQQQVELDVSSWAAGIYMARVQFGDRVVQQRVVVQ